MAFGEFAESVNERVEPSTAAEEMYVGLDDLDSGSMQVRRWGKGSDVIGRKLRFRKGDITFGASPGLPAQADGGGDGRHLLGARHGGAGESHLRPLHEPKRPRAGSLRARRWDEGQGTQASCPCGREDCCSIGNHLFLVVRGDGGEKHVRGLFR